MGSLGEINSIDCLQIPCLLVILHPEEGLPSKCHFQLETEPLYRFGWTAKNDVENGCYYVFGTRNSRVDIYLQNRGQALLGTSAMIPTAQPDR